MADTGPGRVIYVGSIPYDQTEEQILDIFRSVGPVVNFRLVFDKDSGKSKGFGFVEYHDAETAASAVRNLNNYQIGSRNLKVDFSHETSIAPMFTSKPRGDLLPSLPVGTPPPAGSTAHDAITQVLMSFNEEQMAQLVSDAKSMATNNPSKAIELFKTSPQLSYIVVQAMLALRMIDNNTILSLVDRQDLPTSNTDSISSPQSNSSPQQNLQPVDYQKPVSQPSQEQQPQQQYQPQQEQQLQQQPQLPQQQRQQPSNADPQQIELIRQVMQLTDDQIAALPLDHRNTLNALRERVLRGEIQI